MSKVSIIIPNYNYGKYLPSAMNSIAYQTYQNLEIIVIDGGSTDNSLQIIQDYALRFSNFRYISEKDNGQAHAINKGLKLATGEFITWLNSDDRLEKDAIEHAVKEFQQNPSLSLVYGSIINTDESGKFLKLNIGHILPKDDIVHWDYIPQTGAIFKNSKAIKLDEKLNWGFDWDLWIQLSLAGDFKGISKVMGYCITQGNAQRKSDQITVKRSQELFGIYCKYVKFITPRKVFSTAAIALGTALSLLQIIDKNYYARIAALASRAYKLFSKTNKEIML